MTFYQPGAYDHSVLYTTAQLTEGRSARDQPKQPPAKKKKYNTARTKEITDQLWLIRDGDNTRRVSPFRPDGPEFPCYLVWRQRDGRSHVLLDTATTDTLVLDQPYFRPLGIKHSGVLRAGLELTRNIVVNQDAQEADRKKVPAEVIQVDSHEVDTDSHKDESIVATSGSEGSESASELEQNDPPSSLVSDAEQYERMQASYAAVAVTLKTKRTLCDGPLETFLLFAKMC